MHEHNVVWNDFLQSSLTGRRADPPPLSETRNKYKQNYRGVSQTLCFPHSPPTSRRANPACTRLHGPRQIDIRSPLNSGLRRLLQPHLNLHLEHPGPVGVAVAVAVALLFGTGLALALPLALPLALLFGGDS